MSRPVPAFVLPAIAGLMLAGPAMAQSKVTLRVADVYPVGHFVMTHMTKPWMEAVTKATNGQAEFQYYPAEQLGKGRDLLSLTQSGVADIGLVIPGWVSDKMPLSAVAELPGGFSTGCQGTAALWKLATNGILSTAEYQPNGVRVLFATVLPPYQIFAKQRLDSLKAFEGVKVYSSGGAKDLSVRKLKAVPVRMSITDMYESISRGTIDGALISIATARTYNLPGLVKSGTLGENFGSGVITYVISEAKWKQLPPAVQAAMQKAGDDVTRSGCVAFDGEVDAEVEKMKQGGVAMIRLPDADRKEIAELMGSVSTEWAQDLDKRGKPGTETLKAFTAALAGGS